MKERDFIFAPVHVLREDTIPSPREIMERRWGKEKADEFFRKNGENYFDGIPWHGWFKITRK